MFSEIIEQAGPLITVWLQVRVLPGPPAFAREASEGCRAEASRRRRAIRPASYGSASQIAREASEGCRAEASRRRRAIRPASYGSASQIAREASEGCRAEAHLGEGGLCTRATARQATPTPLG